MNIHTSYYGNLKKLKTQHPDWLLISTSGWIPDEILNNVDTQDKSLAPSKDIYNEYKKNPDWKKYVQRFKTERLTKINWFDKLCDWEELAKEKNKDINNIVLLCYETADTGDGVGDFCHRFILAENFENEFKTEIKEYGFEHYDRIDYRMKSKISTDFLF